jgi:uncharacterized protein YqeY
MLRDDVKAAQISAMKSSDKPRTAALRSIMAKIKDKDIALRTADKKPEDDAMVTDVLQKMAKQRRESITLYDEGGRDELADREREEIAVIEEFLPVMLSEEETMAIVTKLKDEIGASGMQDMGKLMGQLKAKHGGEIDMSKASAIVKAALAG